MEVDELGLERRQVGRQLGHRLAQLADSRLLERGVGDDAVSLGGSANHCAGELGPRVVWPFGEKRRVRVGPVGLALVVAELRGRLLPGEHPGPHRDGALDRLEVQESQPAAERLKRTCKRGLDDQSVLGNRFQLAPLREVQVLAWGEVLDRADAALEIRHGPLRPNAG